MTDAWTPEMQAWLDDVLARRTKPTVRQLDIVRTEYRKTAQQRAA